MPNRPQRTPTPPKGSAGALRALMTTPLPSASRAAVAGLDADARTYLAARRKREEAKAARRPATHTVDEPSVREMEGGAVVAVSLCGTRGKGREMVMDAADWARLSAEHGTHYVVEENKAAMGYCISPEGRDPPWPILPFVAPGEGRLILWNGSLLDMRRANFRWVTEAYWDRLDNPFPRLPRRAKAPKEAPKENDRRFYAPPGTTSAQMAAILFGDSLAASPGKPKAGARPPGIVATSEAGRAAAPHSIMRDGVPCMAVPLIGEHGAGKVAVVNLLDYDRLALFIGVDGWSLYDNGAGHLAVVSYTAKARRMAGDLGGTTPRLRIARFIVGAGEGMVVSYQNGDACDLRRSNLTVETRREYFDQRRVRSGGPTQPDLLLPVAQSV